MHFHIQATTLSLFDKRSSALSFSLAESLIAFFVLRFESVIGWWSRSSENNSPVLEDVALGERSVTVLLEELMGVEILSCRFATTHEEEMVAH